MNVYNLWEGVFIGSEYITLSEGHHLLHLPVLAQENSQLLYVTVLTQIEKTLITHLHSVQHQEIRI